MMIRRPLESTLLASLSGFAHEFGSRQGPLSQNGMASLTQVHSATCLRATTPGPSGEGDALITCEPGLAVSIRTADCFPILLADTRLAAVGAIHAGWRGTAAGIVAETIRRMGLEFGTNPGDIYAAIGPGIGECCYEVGPEVARQFGSKARCIDLAEANRRHLVESGVPEAQIDMLGLCTFCRADLFHSFRRDQHRAGRMISWIRVGS